MVGLSLEESTISESSLDASTAPTTLTGHSTANPSRESLPRPPDPTPTGERARKERSSSTLTGALTKELSLLLRPDSSRLNRDSHSGTQTALHPPSEEHKDRSDYAHNLSNNSSNLSKMDLMLRQRDTDKVKRSENKFYGFLRKGRLPSRSAPKKRRSRSADEINQMDQAMQSALSLTNDTRSVRDHPSRSLPPPIKRGPTGPSSRPPSTAAVTPNKQLPQLPSNTNTSTPHPTTNSGHVMSHPEHPKPRKKTFFGMISLPASRRSSISKSRPATPLSSTPDNSSSNPRHQRKQELSVPKHRDLSPIPLNDTTNCRWNADVAGQRSQPSFEISEPDSGLGIETIVTIVSPRPHLKSVPDVPIRPSSTPPRVGNAADRLRRVSVDGPGRSRLMVPSTSGRVSPLMALANSKVFGGRQKGKGREVNVNRANDVRKKTTPTPTSSDDRKGRESRNSKSNAHISGPMNIGIPRARVKHGSFDFERPLSTSVGYPVRNARWSSSGSYPTSPTSPDSERIPSPRENRHLWNNPNPSTYPIQEERHSLTRSQSVREPDRERGQLKIRFTDETKDTQARTRNPPDTRSRNQPPPQHSSLKPTGREPGSPRNGNTVSTHTKPQLSYRPEGGSWGRHSTKRLAQGGTGHTNGLPSFGTSATALHLGGDAARSLPRSNSPQPVTLPMDRRRAKRNMVNGRSLDLGLDLNWAPTRVREEAVMDFSEMGVRSKWREEAEVKESCKMKVFKSFERVLEESENAKFREYVQRFDSRLIPLDGLITKVGRLLDTPARGLEVDKKGLLDKLESAVQHSR